MGKYGNSDGDLDATVNTTLSKPKDPKMQAAKVQMPIGTSKDFELHRGSDGDALFNLVSADLSIEERDYFSLCFYDNEGIRHWLYNDKKILRQLKGSISNLPVYLSFLGLPWEFSYEVKFYPTEPTTLSDDNARYNLFLQLRKDVASGRLPATIPTHALLGALVAQAEYGDADCSADYEQQLKGSLKIPNSNDPSQLMQLLDRVKEIHREHKGLTASDAQSKYLDACKQLSMYGVFVFDAKDKDDSNVGIGICATGVNIYKETIRVHRFVWQNIVKISYRKNTFSVKIKEGEHNKKEITLTYKVHDYISAKRVWKCGVEHHTFFRLIQPEIKPKGGLFRWGSTRFRYSGRTQFQTKMASQMFNNSQGGTVPRSTNARLTQSFDHGLNKENDPVLEKTFGRDGEPSSPGVSYDIASSKKAGSTNGKGKKIKGEHGKDSSDSFSSDEESGFKVVESTIVEQICELQTPHPDVNTSPSRGGPESLGEFVSSKIVTSGNRTIETITYKAERGGEVETYVEHRVTINSDVPIDHDAELNAAILEATKLNPEFSVERIEVRQEAST